ncbi:TRAP transporter small permease [Azospirillum sp. RWY-5-1]|uniref:TRAP transporter small permease protein n=1 Tax=Azospirillum oleiclasticum TaxID=2735135 RepID=A0ABX2TL84_9PROT|nr:TRAP transporter small permease [Azospirillum oleiclasticum]NYZ16609.1 TRAP transporter small permease [Azospirillum oleiclasticum]NYZ24096.1 TRAP transporter small permease [Azospirillum oleiclasticum]
MDLDMQADDSTATPPAAIVWLTRINATLARFGMYAAVAGLLVLVAVVFYQVFGRYVMNSSPTWTENLAIVLVLYVTLIGAAVGVRDAGHISLESLMVLLPEKARRRLEILIYAAVGLFGVAMAYNGWILGSSVAHYLLPNLHISEAVRYVPLVLSGILIASFSVEHIIAILRGEEVVPSWN